jgi:GT2 family glycosyltransferase
MSDPLVVCVILNTNRRADTLECLASLRASTYRRVKILLLDNQSTDGTVAAVSASFPEVQIVNLEQNRGYAGNNNVGIQLAMKQGADWVFVLNEDIVLAPDCLEHLVVKGESDPGIGIVGPMVYHHDEPGIIQSAGGGFSQAWEGFHFGQNEPDTGRFREPHEVQWISGCAILVRRGVIDAVGAIDERFFIYWEETEWCLRAGLAGWRLYHVPEAKIWHKGVQRDYRPKPSVTYYSTRNRFLMLATHRAPLRAWTTAWVQILRTLASWSIRPKWRHKRDHRDAMWHGVTDFLRHRFGPMPQQRSL